MPGHAGGEGEFGLTGRSSCAMGLHEPVSLSHVVRGGRWAMVGFRRKLEDVEVWMGAADRPHVENLMLPELWISAEGPCSGDTRPGFCISFTSPAGPGRTRFRVWVPASVYAQIALAMQQGDPHVASVVFNALAGKPKGA